MNLARPSSKEDAYATARAFLRNQALDGWQRDLVAAAVAEPIREQAGAMVLGHKHFNSLLETYEDEARQGELWRLTWHGLLYSYFNFDPTKATNEASRKGWEALRDFLQRTWSIIDRQAGKTLVFDFVQPGLLGSLEAFGKTYRRPIECETEEQMETLAKLQNAISPQTLRRTKQDIASELPKKSFAAKLVNEAGLQFKPILGEEERLEIAMTEHQRILYKGGLKKLQDAANEGNSRKRAQLSFGALHLMKAVCAEPYCLPGTKFLVDKGGRSAHLANSPKLSWLLDQLKIVQLAGEKAIVFTELREAQAALYYFLREEFKIKPYIINGDSQGRQGYIDKFSAKEGFDVIILSTLAAGAGLNVTAANHVFHFTRAWNPSKESQATDRAFRIGQVRDVFVYCPTIVAGDFSTFEVRLDQLLKRKAGLAGATLDSSNLESMLNGTGKDATFSELVGGGEGGEGMPNRILTLDDIDRLDGDGFEALCCLLWKKQGFETRITEKRGGDGGIDIVALKGWQGELIQCKSSKGRDAGWDAVKEVVAGAARYQAIYTGTKFRRVAVTNQRFTSGAISHAEANKVMLLERSQIEKLLSDYPVGSNELDDEISS